MTLNPPVNTTTAVPPVLLPYQQRWISDRSPVKVIEKSRRIGISWCEAADCALVAAAKDGQDSWYLGYNQPMAEEFILDCANWSKAYQLSAAETQEFVLKDEDKDILAYRIRYASGHRVTALSSRPSNLRGKQGRVIIDEAAFHEDFPELLKAAIAHLMWGGSVHIISTHNGIDNHFYRLVEDIRSGKQNYSLHRVSVDDAIADGLVKRICLKLGILWSLEYEREWRSKLFETYGDDADEELLVVPSRSGGVYLSSTLVESRMVADGTVLRLSLPDSFNQLDEVSRQREIYKWLTIFLTPELQKLPKNLRSWYGMDFARSGDLSAIAILIEEKNLHRRCPLILEMRNTPFAIQRQILFYLIDALGGRFCGGAHDARGNGQYLAEAAGERYRGRVDAVMATDAWYLQSFPPYKAALEEGNFTLPKDSDVLTDHTAIRLEKGIPKVPSTARYKGIDGGVRHGDTAIALLLAFYACRTKPRPLRSSYPSSLGQKPISGMWY